MAATAPTMSRPVGAAPVELEEPAPGPSTRARERAGVLLLGALLAAILYAIFAHGAAPQPEEARLQVGLSLIAVVALAALLWTSGLRVAAPAAAWAGLGLLAAFAAWSGLSMTWTVFPSATWTELNRAIAYALVVALALAAGSWYPRAVSRAALGYVAVALLVALYALLAKIVPAVHIGGLVDFDKTTTIARLREPLEYWNALALVLAMAVPIVLRLAVDETRTRRGRLGALAIAPIFLVTMGLTYSRGGVIAAVVAIAVTMLAAGSRLRTLLYAGLALAAAVPALWFGLTADDLTHNVVSLSAREDDGLVLGLLVVGPIASLAVVGRVVMGIEARTAPSPARSRRIGRVLAGVLVAAALVGVVAMATSNRGLTGSVTHAWDDFRSPRGGPGLFDPGRLASTNAGNRWVWWSEAVGAWSDRPLEGWGAGSFPVTHREYRSNRLDVLQPHSVPLQFLAETGLVGFVLAMGGVLLLLAGAVGAVRRLVPGPERGLAAALLGAATAWLVHSGYDWDWDMPGATLPALVFLGLLCARGRAWSGGGWRPARLGTGARTAILVAGTLALVTVAVSAALPSWGETKTEGALASVERRATPDQLRAAQADADFASRIDPVSYEPLLAASSLAARRGREAQARKYLMDAIRRAPNSVIVWLAVARFEVDRGDAANVYAALRHTLELDPRNRTAPLILASQQLLSVPPSASPTATGTPLVAVVGQTPATRRLQPQAVAPGSAP
jgi:hypothetical protein